jgi:hypothetical protein
VNATNSTAPVGNAAIRCQSKNRDGIQCGFPNGHYGNHGNGIAVVTWTDEPVMIPSDMKKVDVYQSDDERGMLYGDYNYKPKG